MKQVIIGMAVVVATTIYGAYKLSDYIPSPIATAVIAEKPGKTMGGSSAVLLPQNLSNKQSYLLNAAYAAAKAEGLKNPEIMQVILLQETRAGSMKSYKVANAGPDAYYGPMQVKLAATRDVLARNPSMYAKYDFHTKTDDEVKANLILNEKFNIEVAAKYVGILQVVYGLSGRELTNAYNRGAAGVKRVGADFHYAIEGERKLADYKRRGKV